jgi:hypothetical protein
MGRTGASPVTGARRFLQSAVCVAAAVLVADALRRVVLRMRFDYDLLLWGDDYFMTSMLKLVAGVPVYTELSDANSTVYAPAGPYLHHALLAPFGLSASLLANRVLHQLWLVIAIGLGTAVVLRLRRDDTGLATRWERLGFGVLAALTLALAAYANPVADSLHPTNLELCVLAGSLLALTRLDRSSSVRRVVVAALLSAAALLVKQSTALPVALAFAWWIFRLEGGTLARRFGLSALVFGGPSLILAALLLWTRGHFKTWGFDVLASHPFDWWKVSDIYAGYFLLFAPAVLVAVGVAVVGRASEAPSWRRAASLVLFYAPFALAALFKTMGGPNNLAVVGWLCLVIALPEWLSVVFGVAKSRQALLGSFAALALLAVELGLLHPRRRIPDVDDDEKTALMCDYAAARARCGEHVFLGRGAICLHRGGVSVPKDRMMSVIEATVAGRARELGFYDRLRSMEYDLLIFWVGDLEWGGKDLWDILRLRYRPFFMTRGELEGDFWYHGWQGFTTWPVAYWERIEDAGRHEVSERGRRCDFEGASALGGSGAAE